MKLQLTNTLHKTKELFTPLCNNTVSLYVCGITPYDRTHIGHGRVYVTFDVLTRLLEFLAYKVTYVRNFTDIDDKIIHKAERELHSSQHFKAIADRYIKLFHEDLDKLGCLRPHVEPRVTESIDKIIMFVQELIDLGHAYQLEHDVYFDISTFPSYGSLSGKQISELEAGSRVTLDTRKKNPGDFALWKGNTTNDYWDSPWGYGRPGWHIECSVMAKEYLGKTIDIHGGGIDLIFPHHENEIAQSESLHKKTFAHYWLHNAFVNINKEKMSKSLGNMITLDEVFAVHDPMVLRYYYLQHHYRTPIDFSMEDLNGVATAYKKLIGLFKEVPFLDISQINRNHKIMIELINALSDDLNTSKFIGLIFQHYTTIEKDKLLAQSIKSMIQTVLGLTLDPYLEKQTVITQEIQTLIDEREKARKNKDWKRADTLRDQLLTLGVTLQDKKVS